MNILVLTNVYPYEKDTNMDRTKVVAYFAREWVKQGHNVIVIVNSSAFPKVTYMIADKVNGMVAKIFDVSKMPNRLWTEYFNYEDAGVHVENVPMLKLVPHGRFLNSVLEKQILNIITILKKYNFIPDVITGHWVNPQIMLVSELAKIYKAKSAFVFHSDFTKEKCDKFNVQYYIDRIDHIGFRSKSAADTAETYLKFKEKPFLAASGIPDRFLDEFTDSERKTFAEQDIKIITAARLLKYKKVDVAIRAVAKAFENKQFDYKIIGEGPLKLELEKCINSVGMSKYIHMYGRVSREDLQKEMNRSDVFVLISEQETFGLVYIEAMMQGCIVIASRFGGIDGIIVDEENGFLCEEGNEEELVSIFKKIQRMSSKQKMEISRRAISTAKKYTESIVAKRYLDIICK